jgi:hypothetical protein
MPTPIGFNWDDVWQDVWQDVWSADAPVVADRPIPSWYYTPGPGLGSVDAAVRRELDRISQATRGAAPYVQFQVLHVEPDRPRKGLEVYADGVDWNPGSGEGKYVYKSTGWTFLG